MYVWCDIVFIEIMLLWSNFPFFHRDKQCADTIYLMVHPFPSFAILAFQISVSLFLGSLFFLICLICLFLYCYHTVFIYYIIKFL